ncbi:MAG TPA: hypothetical protein P5224_05690 [Mesotoga sp.]|nr:hypothetical protein [Mesotoga sp.]
MWDDRSGCWLLVVGNAKIGYRPQEPVSPHFRRAPLFALSKDGSMLWDGGRLF